MLNTVLRLLLGNEWYSLIELRLVTRRTWEGAVHSLSRLLQVEIVLLFEHGAASILLHTCPWL
jgi:hypothetical protein